MIDNLYRNIDRYESRFFASVLSRLFIRYIRQPVVSARFSRFLLSFDNVYSLFVIRYILISTICFFLVFLFFPPSNVFDPLEYWLKGMHTHTHTVSFRILSSLELFLEWLVFGKFFNFKKLSYFHHFEIVLKASLFEEKTLSQNYSLLVNF